MGDLRTDIDLLTLTSGPGRDGLARLAFVVSRVIAVQIHSIVVWIYRGGLWILLDLWSHLV